MSSQKCPACGLINWSSEESCKRCNAPLHELDESPNVEPAWQSRVEAEKPSRVLGLLLIVWGVLLCATGLILFAYSGITHAVLVGGPIIAVSGILVMGGRRAGVYLYFLSVAIMAVWLAKTQSLPLAIGSSIWQGLIGLLVAKRRFPILAGLLILISCLSLLAPFIIAGLLKHEQKVAWREFRPSHGLFSVNMPADPIAQNPVVMNIQKYTMTKNCYESTIARQGGVVYCVADFSPPISVEKVTYEKMLEAELDNLVGSSRSILASKQSTTVNGYPGLEFEMKPPENVALRSPKNFGKIFMNSDHYYFLMITASEGSELLAGKDGFLNPSLSYRP